nr:lipocalin family protein [uncultured Flavobacterium sp.]
MNKLSILFVSVMTLGLSVTSCSSDDDKGGSIQGKWELTEVGVLFSGKETLEPATNQGCANDIVEFTADGKLVDTYAEFYNNKCNSYSEDGTWTKDGNKLVKKYGSDTEEYEIKELSENKLKLVITYTEGGVSISAVQVFKKI